MANIAAAQGRRRDAVAVALVFVVVNLVLVAINGVRIGGDTPLYLDGASRLLDGEALINREPSYLGYIVVVAIAQGAGAGLAGVVLMQVAIGAVAASAVYGTATALAGRVAGIIAAVLFSVDVDTNRWHQFVLADSIYLSLFTVAVFLTYQAATSPRLAYLIGAAVTLVTAAFVRPEGWFLIPAAVCYVIVMRARSTPQKWIGLGALLAAGAVIVTLLAPAVRGNVEAVGPADMLRRGQTIWDFDGWRVAMPESTVSSGDQASGAISYALQYPFSTLKLMLARVGVHFAHVRPFYSAPHNAAIVLWLLPLYSAVLFAIWRLRSHALVIWILAALATQTLVVALTHAEWDGRYLAHVTPLLYVLTGAAIAIASGWAPTQAAHREIHG